MDEGLLSIISAGYRQLLKILITLEPHGIFRSNFAYKIILTLFCHWYAKWWRGIAEHYFGPSMHFSENAHNS